MNRRELLKGMFATCAAVGLPLKHRSEPPELDKNNDCCEEVAEPSKLDLSNQIFEQKPSPQEEPFKEMTGTLTANSDDVIWVSGNITEFGTYVAIKDCIFHGFRDA